MLPKELVFLSKLNHNNKKCQIGDIIFFGYNSLESFYDRFPLVLVLSLRKNQTILGFNLHYIPLDIRLLLLEEMKNSGPIGTRTMSRDKIPRRYFTNAIKSYSLYNILTPIKVFTKNELNGVINTIIPVYDPKREVDIIRYLDKTFIEERQR